MNMTAKRAEMLQRLFERSQVGGVVFYLPRFGMDVEAAESWRDTGVCPDCHRRSISGGRCLECGEDVVAS